MIRSDPEYRGCSGSLGTKDLRTANTLVKPVLMEFDAILAKEAALLSPNPKRDSLSEREIADMADYYFASMLREDEVIPAIGTWTFFVFAGLALADLFGP